MGTICANFEKTLMENTGLENLRESLFRKRPMARHFDSGLKSNDNRVPLFYVAESVDTDISGCWWALMRLPRHLESKFGLNGEILVLFSHFSDLQSRTYNALVERLPTELRNRQLETEGIERYRPDPSLLVLVSGDIHASDKVLRWNTEGSKTPVVPLTITSENTREETAEQLQVRIEHAFLEVISERDLYKGRDPVTGNDFFGRESTLRTLRGHFSQGQSVGLFGLRRSGKTSVLREFKRRYAREGYIVVSVDLEDVFDLSSVANHVASDINSALSEAKRVDSSIWIGNDAEREVGDFASLGSRIIKVAEKNSNYKFVFAFDEIESLVPHVSNQALAVRTFLGAIRRAAQGRTNVSLLLTGVTTKFFRESILNIDDGTENPLFGFVEEEYLGPFTSEEAHNLLRRLGRSMNLLWEDQALNLVWQLSGGIPFLIRELASRARNVARSELALPTMEAPIITTEIVNEAFDGWRDSAAELWKQIVDTLNLHHQMMGELVRCTSSAQIAEWMAIGEEAERAARSLEGLGLLARENTGWDRSDSLIALQSLARAGSLDADAVRKRRETSREIEELIQDGESEHLEFKQTARFNPHTSDNKDDRLTDDILKSVAAFLNADGGTLLVGVHDSGLVVGVAPDLKLFGNNQDQLQLWFQNTLNESLGSMVVSQHVSYKLIEVEKHFVVRLDVTRSSSVVWCKTKDGSQRLFVRSGNQSPELQGYAITDFARKRSQ